MSYNAPDAADGDGHLRIFWAWRQHMAALDCHTPLRVHGKDKKANNNQPAGGDVWKPSRFVWCHGSSPLRPWPKLWQGEGTGLRKTTAPFSWVKKKYTKYSKNNQPVGGDVWVPLRDYRGSQKRTLALSFLILAGRQRREALALDDQNSLQSMKNN